MPGHDSEVQVHEVDVVTFYFDPACPWTWLTSRWLVDAAGSRSVPIEYRPFDLSKGQSFDHVPAEHRSSAMASRRFLRAVVVAHRQGEDDLIGRWYTSFGNARWNDRVEASGELVERTLLGAGGNDLLSALDDESLDGAVAESRNEAVQLAGDDAGSPVTLWQSGESKRGFFGPVVAPQPTGADSDSLWATMIRASRTPQLFELKTRRTARPAGAMVPQP